MGLQKKHGKGRLDKWYKLAKEKGYRARAAFKLIQLNKKYHFLEKSKVLLDLCAAPGSWCQVAAEVMPPSSLILGVDLAPIKTIPKVTTFQGDITTEKCRATIRQHFKTWKADTVLHDGAPNVGTAWVQDAFSQAELALQAMKLAVEFLVEGGTFVTKVFRSKDYNSLLWVFNQLFSSVEATKPPSSRNVSAEIFVVCRGYKSPKRIDPKFLDPKFVFAELAEGKPNVEAKVFNPEKKRRKRDGYEEGVMLVYKEEPVSAFIETEDPIDMLGTLNKLVFKPASDDDLIFSVLDKLPETKLEIRNCCNDLRVLGKKDFRQLLRWRLKIREQVGLSAKEEETEEVAEVEEMDEELRIQKDLQKLSEKEAARKKRDRRKENEKKQKDITRMELHMTAPMDIALEQAGPEGADAMFAVKKIGTDNLATISKGKMVTIVQKEQKEESDHSDSDSDTVEDALEEELDHLYEEYQERKSARDDKHRARMARAEHEDGEWNGIAEDASSDSDVLQGDSDSDSDMSSSEDDLDELDEETVTNGESLSTRADRFFQQDLFKEVMGTSIDDLIPDEESEQDSLADLQPDVEMEDASDDGGFEVVRREKKVNEWGEVEDEAKQSIDIVTAEAMALAQDLATGRKSKHDLADDGFNKLAFRDRDGLPEWFLDDEKRHSKPHTPITKEAANAIKEKLRALNARPIKKVKEAKDRKKFKAHQRLEKLRKKSALLAEDDALSEKDKAQSIAKLMNRAAKKKPQAQVKIVVARGANRGISGRPKGVRGKYKIVDARMKKDLRAAKRVAKRNK